MCICVQRALALCLGSYALGCCSVSMEEFLNGVFYFWLKPKHLPAPVVQVMQVEVLGNRCQDIDNLNNARSTILVQTLICLLT